MDHSAIPVNGWTVSLAVKRQKIEVVVNEIIVPRSALPRTVNSSVGECGVELLLRKQFIHPTVNNHVDYCDLWRRANDLEDNEEISAIVEAIHSPALCCYHGERSFKNRQRSSYWPLVLDIINRDEVLNDDDDEVPELLVEMID
jgi:hypothetical protein